jgi:exodeoxyribonuclease V beta subunit
VYLPFAFNRNIQTRDVMMFHDGDTRCLHIGGELSPDYAAVQQQGRREAAGDDVRLTYVAMTRAQSQVVAWWAPSNDEPNGGLSRLLRGRGPGDPVVPDRCIPPRIDDPDAMALLRRWADEGGPALEEAIVAPPANVELPIPAEDLAVRHFHRQIDAMWRRTSYSGLIRAAEADISQGVSSDPEVIGLDDEIDELGPLPSSAKTGSDVASPMADLPRGTKFGTLVHAVLETADPFAADLTAELVSQIETHSVWWPVEVPSEQLAEAMVPLHDTPLGPLAGNVTLRQIGLRDRLREMDFEFPLAGGDLRAQSPDIRLADVGLLLRQYLPADDPLRSYADRLANDALGSQPLRGYLTGSVDAVLRVGERYLIVDYKTNWLGTDAPLTAADYQQPRLVEAMLHSDYPLQALLYSVVVHRFLRWRQPGYDPETHLGGVLYLFLRGMCGPDTPAVDGHPAGVFSWRPPAALVVAVSDLLHAGGAA